MPIRCPGGSRSKRAGGLTCTPADGYKTAMPADERQPAPTLDDAAYRGSRIDDLPDLWDGFAKLVREGPGISGFGVQIMDLPPDYATRSHNEGATGQQELYVALRGSGHWPPALAILRVTR